MKDPLLSFDFILRKFPWGIFILLGTIILLVITTKCIINLAYDIKPSVT